MIDYDTTLLLTAVILAVPYSAALSEGFFFLTRIARPLVTASDVVIYRIIAVLTLTQSSIWKSRLL